MFLYDSMENLIKALYTVPKFNSKDYGFCYTEVKDVKQSAVTSDYYEYTMQAVVHREKIKPKDVDPLDLDTTLTFKVPIFNNPMKVSINLALIKPCYKVYTDKLSKIVGASFPAEIINRPELLNNKTSIYIRPGTNELKVGVDAFTLDDYKKYRQMLKTGNFNTLQGLIGDKLAADLRDLRLQSKVIEKLSLVLDLDGLSVDINSDENTWKLLNDIASGVYPYENINETTPYDVDMFDLKRGLLFHLSQMMSKNPKDNPTGKTIKDQIFSQLNMTGKIYATPLKNAIINYYKTNGAILNMVQFVSDTNPLSYYSHSKKLYFVDPNDLTDPNDEDHGKVRVNSAYLDGFLDPVRSQENASNVNFYQELSLGCKIDDDYGIQVKVYDKQFNEVYLPIKDYLNSAILSYDCINYKTKQPKKNANGVYKYCKRARYHVTQNLDDVDYYRHEASLLSASTALMPMLNRNDVTRDLLQAHFNTQAIPTVGCRPSIIHTQFADAIFDESTNVMKSEFEGEVVGISENNDILEIKDSKGKLHYPHVENKYTASKKHTSNIYVPNVKIGDKVHVGSPIFKFNAFQGRELALFTPLLTTYSTLRGYEVEDGYVISRSAAKKLAHPEFKTVTIKLVKDKYRLEKMFTLDIGDKIDKDGVIFRFEENQLSDLAVSILGGRREAFVELEYKLPKFTIDAHITDIKILFNPMNVDKHHKYYRLMDDWRGRVLLEKREFLHNRIYEDRWDATRDKENECDFIIDITYEAFNEFKLSDKMSNRASSKGVVCAILPDEEMPRTQDGKIVEVVMPALAMASRKNSFSLIECKLTKLSHKLREIIDGGGIDKIHHVLDVLFQEIPVNERYKKESYIGTERDQDGFIRILLDPFDTTFQDYNDDPENVLNQIMAECGIPDGGKEILIDGKTGRKIRTPLLVGWNEYMRAHFISEDKFTASPLIAYYKGGKGMTQELVMGLGHHRPRGQQIGEQELSALLASGKGDVLKAKTTNVSDKDFRIEADITNLLMRLKRD